MMAQRASFADVRRDALAEAVVRIGLARRHLPREVGELTRILGLSDSDVRAAARRLAELHATTMPRTPRAASTSKWCPRCKRTLPIDAFGVNRSRGGGGDGRQSYCRDCLREYQRTRYLATVDRRRRHLVVVGDR